MTGPDGVIQRTRLAAYAWCEDEDRVLLVRVAAGEPGAGQWILPGGGLGFGEDPADGVLRELGEETGHTGRIDDLVDIRSGVFEPAQTRSGHRVHAVAMLYRVTVTGGELRDEVDESSDRAAWVPLHELDALPATDLLRWARERMGG
jgi:ADP-ribose pyrophosphatase YjhB (NUDIX family)